MKKSWYSYCIVWIDKNKKQIFDVVDHYSHDEALDKIIHDADWDENVSKILKDNPLLNIESQKVDTINAEIIIIIPALLEFKELGKKLIKVFCEGI